MSTPDKYQYEMVALLDCGSMVSLINKTDVDQITEDFTGRRGTVPKGGFLKDVPIKRTAITSPLGGRIRFSKKKVCPLLKLYAPGDSRAYYWHSFYVVPVCPTA